jgi:hypothetical protein
MDDCDEESGHQVNANVYDEQGKIISGPFEVHADPKRGPTENYKPPNANEDEEEDVDDDDIIAICNHQKYVGEDQYQLLLQFKSEWRVWGLAIDAFTDIEYYRREQLLEEYLEKHGLMKEKLGLKTTEKKIVEEPESGNAVMDEPETETDSDSDKEEEELVCIFDHKEWLSFQPEGNAAYCGKNAFYNHHSCIGCKKWFHPTLKDFDKGTYKFSNQLNTAKLLLTLTIFFLQNQCSVLPIKFPLLLSGQKQGQHELSLRLLL